MRAGFDEWIRQTTALLRDTHDWLMMQVKSLPPDVLLPLTALIRSCESSSEAVLLLVSEVHNVEAEMLIRAVSEGTIKFVFITHTDSDTRATRATDYMDRGYLFAQLKEQQRIRDTLASVHDPNLPEWQALKRALMPDEQVQELKTKYPKVTRDVHSREWSYGSLCRSLAAADNEFLRVIARTALWYSLSSHFLHQDAMGVRGWIDRALQPDALRSAIESSQAARLILDVLGFNLARAQAIEPPGMAMSDDLRRLVLRTVTIQRDIHKRGAEWQNTIHGLSA